SRRSGQAKDRVPAGETAVSLFARSAVWLALAGRRRVTYLTGYPHGSFSRPVSLRFARRLRGCAPGPAALAGRLSARLRHHRPASVWSPDGWKILAGAGGRHPGKLPIHGDLADGVHEVVDVRVGRVERQRDTHAASWRDHHRGALDDVEVVLET